MLFEALPFHLNAAVHRFQVLRCGAERGPPLAYSFSSALTVALRVERRRRRWWSSRRRRRTADSELSPILSLMACIGSPKVSAATCVMMVRVPVPRSWLPISISTLPSGWMVALHCGVVAESAPLFDADAEAALDGPLPESPRWCQFLPVDDLGGLLRLVLVDVRDAAVRSTFLRKNSRGSMLQLGGQVFQRGAGDIGSCWLFGARQARALPVLMETAVWLILPVRNLAEDVGHLVGIEIAAADAAGRPSFGLPDGQRAVFLDAEFDLAEKRTGDSRRF